MLTAFIVLISVVILDIILSGDNAVVIGMAANTLPQEQRTRAIVFGMILAAVTRIILSLFAIQLLHYRLISIIGGVGLFWVAYRLGRGIFDKDDTAPQVRQGSDFLSAIGLIVIADVSMSLDNVLAVAGIARHNPVIMVFGLMMSIACVGYGAKLVSELLERWKWLNWAGVGLIVVIAIELIFGIQTV